MSRGRDDSPTVHCFDDLTMLLFVRSALRNFAYDWNHHSDSSNVKDKDSFPWYNNKS
jgi:hypothetical protein